MSHRRRRCLRRAQPKQIILLTCDAFGVLPPISKLNPDQVMYHFISSYTAKVTGTEEGMKEPEATFSACFGAPFLVWHPYVYAEMLPAKLEQVGASAWDAQIVEAPSKVLVASSTHEPHVRSASNVNRDAGPRPRYPVRAPPRAHRTLP